MTLYYELMEMVLDETHDISAETINKVCRVSLNEADIISMLESSVNSKQLGIDSQKFNKDVAKTSTKITNLIKSEGLNAKCKSKILQEIKDLYDRVQTYIDYDLLGLNPNVQKEIKKFGLENISRAIALLLGLFIMNTLCGTVLRILFGATIGGYLTGVFVAPLTEESAKQLSMRYGYNAEFMVIFNIFEFTLYMTNPYFLVSAGFEKLFKIRVVAVLSHIAYNITQLLFANPTVQKTLGLDKDNPDDVEKSHLIGQIIAMFLHSSWNSGILSSAVLSAFKLI